eukprot:TRINITY_DN2783_c0_g2_i2.p1 TRINITY_DN2783_c0_g2~~TRINITY_DN2783_c0_g2_i2.p1  ORF type:complete len:287 (+),score=82.26 TRINITY_DN2783_c0_g2_i2:52-912(+)
MLRFTLLATAIAMGSAQTLTQAETAQALIDKVLNGTADDWTYPCRPIRLPMKDSGYKHKWWKEGGMSQEDFMEDLAHGFGGDEGRVNVTGDVPPALVSWGTDGNANFTWRFPDRALNNYFRKAFWNIKFCMWEHGHNVEFTKYDLFHAHAFSFEHDGIKDFGMVFHAKEYPSDLFTGVTGAPFNTSHPSYPVRNILWVASLSQSFLIDSDNVATHPLMKPDWLQLGQADWMDDYYNEVLKARTVDTLPFIAMGSRLGGLNYFTRPTIANLTGTNPGWCDFDEVFFA